MISVENKLCVLVALLVFLLLIAICRVYYWKKYAVRLLEQEHKYLYEDAVNNFLMEQPIGKIYKASEKCSLYGKYVIYLGKKKDDAHIMTKEGEKDIPMIDMLSFKQCGIAKEQTAEYLMNYDNELELLYGVHPRYPKLKLIGITQYVDEDYHLNIAISYLKCLVAVENIKFDDARRLDLIQSVIDRDFTENHKLNERLNIIKMHKEPLKYISGGLNILISRYPWIEEENCTVEEVLRRISKEKENRSINSW